MNDVQFRYKNLLRFAEYRTKIGRHSPGFLFTFFASLGNVLLRTHFLWRTNLSTQISFKAGVSAQFAASCGSDSESA